MWIRYFARTDDSELGRAAATFCDLLIGTGMPVRLVSTRVAELQVDARGRGGGIWDKHRALLLTPMEGEYINAVCGEAADWERFHTPSARRNVLLLADQNVWVASTQAELAAAMRRYDVAFALTEELARETERITGVTTLVACPGMGWA